MAALRHPVLNLRDSLQAEATVVSPAPQLVAQGLKSSFKPIWANDIDGKKGAVYTANYTKTHFHLGSISDVAGAELPSATLAWTSFPCQDLSLAGVAGDIRAKRSGLVWEWLRIIDEMGDDAPPLLVAENVLGLVSSAGGAHYRKLHAALVERGYRVGTMLLDAVRFVEFFNSQPFKLNYDARRTLASVIRNLLDQALQRQKKSPGSL
ncbi:DNA cytosine methyltransferase [Rugamonas rivuli]|uniref:DNA cytosine methyltransferase n=1 Tax=Rugamonas rivuli TaxID=2743358 RepID=UPI001C2CE498|nr:DNA cytosine methyltransferase [Rugamonas rivuli]